MEDVYGSPDHIIRTPSGDYTQAEWDEKMAARNRQLRWRSVGQHLVELATRPIKGLHERAAGALATLQQMQYEIKIYVPGSEVGAGLSGAMSSPLPALLPRAGKPEGGER